MLRFSVGKTLRLLRTLTAAGNWNLLPLGNGGGWQFPAIGSIRHVPGALGLGVDGIETVNSVVTPGTWYRIVFGYTDTAAAGNSFLKFYPGDFTVSAWTQTNISGSVTIDFLVRSGTKIRFIAQDDLIISGAIELYEWDWNDPTEKDVIVDSTQFRYSESDFIVNLKLGFLENLEIYGDTYDTIRTYTNCECPVKVDHRDAISDDWDTIFYGSIYIKDVEWDLKTKTLKCDIDDDSTTGTILKNKTKEIRVDYAHYMVFSGTQSPYYTAQWDDVFFHDPSTGAYNIATDPILRVDKLLQIVVFEATDGQVFLNTSSLANRTLWNQDGAVTDFLGVTTWRTINLVNFLQANPVIFTTLEDVLDQYNRSLNVWAYLVNSTLPELYVDRLDLVRTDSGLTFSGVSDIVITNEPVFKNTINGFSLRDIDDKQGTVSLYTNNRCAENDDELVLKWLGGNTNSQTATPLNNVIWNTQQGGTKYTDDLFLVEYYDTGAVYNTSQGANLEYNPRFSPLNWMTRFTTYLKDQYRNVDDEKNNIYLQPNNFVITGTNGYKRKVKFTYYMTMAEFVSIIQNPYQFITILSDLIDPATNSALSSTFVLTSFEYNPETRNFDITIGEMI